MTDIQYSAHCAEVAERSEFTMQVVFQSNRFQLVQSLLIGLAALLLAGDYPTAALVDQDSIQVQVAAASENDVSTFVENLGNPFMQRFPASPYPRNVWDMEVFQERLYFGHGNSNNEPPSPNAGPIEVWFYDEEIALFGYDYVVQEEQIDKYVVDNGRLYIPGHDPREGQQTSNIYFYEGDEWTRRGTLHNALHVYDIAVHREQLFVSVGVGTRSTAVVASSSDDALSWTMYSLAMPDERVGIIRGWELFEVGDDLVVSVVPAYALQVVRDSAGDFVETHVDQLTSTLYHLEENEAGPQFVELSADLFAGLSNTSDVFPSGRVVRPVQFRNVTVYIGAKTYTDHNWTPFGLFSVDASYNVRILPLESDMQPWDLLVDADTLYVLLFGPQLTGESAISILATCDLVDWHEVLRFSSSTFARSFALYNNDFYFGLGTQASPLSSNAGDILRVQNQNDFLGC